MDERKRKKKNRGLPWGKGNVDIKAKEI